MSRYFPVWLLGMRTFFFMQIYFAQVPHIFYSVNSECFLSPIIKGVSIPTSNRVHWQETEDKKKYPAQTPSVSFQTHIHCTAIKKLFRCCNNFVQAYSSTLTLKSLFTANTKHWPKAQGQKSTACSSALRLLTSMWFRNVI